jgi:hypothetical protein
VARKGLAQRSYDFLFGLLVYLGDEIVPVLGVHGKLVHPVKVADYDIACITGGAYRDIQHRMHVARVLSG